MVDSINHMDTLLRHLKRRSLERETAASTCPDDCQTAAYLDGRLPLAEERRLVAHLADCSQCRRILTACVEIPSIENHKDKPFDPVEMLEAELSAMEQSLGLDKRPQDDCVRPRIMVVDDDPIYLSSLVDTLSAEFSVTACADGYEAIRGVKDDIQAVVLDIKMACLSGLEVAKKLKANHGAIAIIFNTGYPGDFVREDIEARYHPFGYVTKDDPDRLLRFVRQASGSQGCLTA